jgi:RNA-directed DNA polymerase
VWACFVPVASGHKNNAWFVDMNNGEANVNNDNNDGYVLVAVPGRPPVAGEYQGEVTFKDLYGAYLRARGSKCSHNQLEFEAHLIDNLLDLQERLNNGTWTPSKPISFVAQSPKAREIHAPTFSDRVVHHLLVPRLEAIYEPYFAYDSYSNREGKGTHAAVSRVSQFIRQVHSGQGGGWILQLDISNFFNSIRRETLLEMVLAHMRRHGVPLVIQRAVAALLTEPPLAQGVTRRSTAEERARVPMHKRLENAAPGCGIHIGNLSSQFLANVYMDVFDQFVKHVLKAKRYARYVDDFVLVHESREQLEEWLGQIEWFLQERLQLQLKPDIKFMPTSAGVDFLGYVILPTHNRVRQRVISHARQALALWERDHVRNGRIRTTPAELQQVKAIWRSYQGHFTHAASWRLQQGFLQRFAWLSTAMVKRRFDHRAEHQHFNFKVMV